MEWEALGHAQRFRDISVYLMYSEFSNFAKRDMNYQFATVRLR